MTFFKNLEEKAKKELGKAQNPKPYVDERKFRNPDQVNYEEPYLKLDELPIDLGDGFNDYNFNDQINLFPSQKPESFHFFILENQYQDLERMIRGVKDVWDKTNEKWMIKRKEEHCFTDEESEEIVRTAQSHLSSDIKLAIINREEYPLILNSIYNQLWCLFKEIMDYRFGRFGTVTKQHRMKLQATNIFNALTMRIKANYSRAIEGRENRSTHDSVKGQESLNQPYKKEQNRGYS